MSTVRVNTREGMAHGGVKFRQSGSSDAVTVAWPTAAPRNWAMALPGVGRMPDGCPWRMLGSEALGVDHRSIEEPESMIRKLCPRWSMIVSPLAESVTVIMPPDWGPAVVVVSAVDVVLGTAVGPVVVT